MSLPILHLSADLSKIDYNSGGNNSRISKVYDLSTNNYDATATGSVYTEEYEGVKSFAFKSQTNCLLRCATFPAFGTSSWSMAVSYANCDLALLDNLGAIMTVGGLNGTGSYTAPNCKMWCNGVETANIAVAAASRPTSAGLQVRFINGSTSGSLHEAIVYNRVTTAAEDVKIGNYFYMKSNGLAGTKPSNQALISSKQAKLGEI